MRFINITRILQSIPNAMQPTPTPTFSFSESGGESSCCEPASAVGVASPELAVDDVEKSDDLVSTLVVVSLLLVADIAEF